MKNLVQLSQERAEEFYAEHQGKSFFPRLVEFMTSGPLYAMVLGKDDAVKAWRALMGPTNALVAKEQQPTWCVYFTHIHCTSSQMHVECFWIGSEASFCLTASGSSDILISAFWLLPLPHTFSHARMHALPHMWAMPFQCEHACLHMHVQKKSSP